MSHSHSDAEPISPEQIQKLIASMEHLARLVNPLTALLSGASGLSGGAGQRLEELIQQLTSVATGLNRTVEVMDGIFGPEGSFRRQEERLAQIEAAIGILGRQGTETTRAIKDMQVWMSGGA